MAQQQKAPTLAQVQADAAAAAAEYRASRDEQAAAEKAARDEGDAQAKKSIAARTAAIVAEQQRAQAAIAAESLLGYQRSARAAYLAAGGLPGDFERDWPALRSDHLRAQAAEKAQQQASGFGRYVRSLW
jgi:hypothetical protein